MQNKYRYQFWKTKNSYVFNFKFQEDNRLASSDDIKPLESEACDSSRGGRVSIQQILFLQTRKPSNGLFSKPSHPKDSSLVTEL